MNNYVKKLNKIEYVITYACTGRCIHCSEGSHDSTGESINADVAVRTLFRVAERYPIETVMTFGGEPLLHPFTVCAIHRAAFELGIKKRQIITNGYFSKDDSDIQIVAKRISEACVNDVLVSVDAFHAECIPVDIAQAFALELTALGVSVRTQPAWLVSPEHDNPYNEKTRELLNRFGKLGITENEGNIVFPSGRAVECLSEYFEQNDLPVDPYKEDPYDVRTLSIEPDGGVLGGNVYDSDIIDIIRSYKP